MRLALALSALLCPTLAHAAGYYVSDIGTRAMARGGAFVAAPDSLLALAYNPAGLSLLKGPQLEIGTHLINFEYSFKRSCPCIDPSNPDAATFDQTITDSFGDTTSVDESGAQLIPFIAAGWGLPWLDITIAFGVWGPPSPKQLSFGTREVPSSNLQPQRYSIVDIDLYEAFYTLGVSISPIDGLRIGATAALFDYKTTQSAHLWANTGLNRSRPEDTDYDIAAVLDFSQNQIFNWGAGVSYTIIPQLSIGASVLGPRAISAPGTVEVKIPEALSSVAELKGKDIEIEVTLPPIVRVGAEVKIEDLLRAEAAFVLEMWGVFDTVTVHPKNVEVVFNGTASPLSDVVLERHLSHTYSLRVGGELDLLKPYLGVKAGYFFEPAAISAERLDPSVPDLDKHGLSAGVSTSWFGFTLELAAQYILLQETVVTNSQAKMTGVLAEAQGGSTTLLTTIGNGTYNGSYFIASASLSVGFDELLGLNDDEKK